MQPLVWLFRFVVIVFLVWIALKNVGEVEVVWLPGQSSKAPLIIWLLVFFVSGVIIGLLAWLPTYVRQRGEISRLRKNAAQVAAMPAPPDSTNPRLVVPPQDTHGV